MTKWKTLNLYAGIGGNRKLWDDVNVVAIEWDKETASIYQEHFPDDEVIITDAHQFLLDNHKDYDFIWSSPPCPTHSVTNTFLYAQGVVRYPDMKLYEEIILLEKFFNGLYCVENVRSYYEPLIKPYVIDRHYFWANFYISPFRVRKNFNIANSRVSTRKDKREYLRLLQELHGFEIDDVKLLRNCVYPPLGKHVLDCARGATQFKLSEFTNEGVKDVLP